MISAILLGLVFGLLIGFCLGIIVGHKNTIYNIEQERKEAINKILNRK